MSTFDPAAFLSATFTEGADVRAILHPPGDWIGYVGLGEKDLLARNVDTKDGVRPLWEVYLYCDDPAAKAEGSSDPARVRYTMWLDTTAEGGLDFSPGHNRDLGYLLMALGIQDKTGKITKPWSPHDWKGRQLRYTVTHEPRRDNGELQARVGKLAAV
jgi:hypothetical protein